MRSLSHFARTAPLSKIVSDPCILLKIEEETMRKLLIGFLAVGLCVLGLGAMWVVRADDEHRISSVR